MSEPRTRTRGTVVYGAACNYCSWETTADSGEDSMAKLIAHTLNAHPGHESDPLLAARPDLWPAPNSDAGETK